MLAGPFYNVYAFSDEQPAEGQFSVTAGISLDPGHAIYQGHFPGNPVVPGVCQIQMVKELVEMTVDLALKLVESDTVKFLSMIVPQQNPQLQCNLLIKKISDRHYTATASIGSGETVFLKFKGKFETEK
jgi:3-hydroxyacyl-[acyl-carrier-protein] dehydratase